ncbi:transposase, MuDR, MULE transposase domain protein [Tanacetum coccineum]
MDSNVKKFKCIIHFNETERGVIMYADMSYSMLYQKMKKKFNLESNDRINLSVRLPSFDSMMDITDDEEVQFFVECASSTNEISHLYVSQPKKEEETANFRSTNQNQIFYKFFEHSPVENIGPSNIDLNTSNFNNNDSNMSFFNNGRQKIEHEVLKPESSFAFESFNQNENEQDHCFDGVDENPQPIHHNWNKFMSFKSDIPETPLYKSKPVISKQYNKVSDVKIGNTFDNQEALDLAVRLKALEDGYQFLSQKTTPDRKKQMGQSQYSTDEGVFEMLFIALGASAWDGNNQIVTIAFGLCKGETGSVGPWYAWNSFSCFMPEELEATVTTPNSAVDAYHMLMEVRPSKWSRAHCHLDRKLPIIMLTETYREMLQKWYFERREVSANMKHEITDWATDKVHKRKLKSALWVVNGIDQNLYQVYDGGHNREVNLMSRSCQCRKWQLSGIPCGHVIAVTRFLGLTDCVQFVADWFKKEKYQGTYAESIHFVGDMHEWELPSHIHPAIPPRMDNPQPGRPKNTNRILSQGEEPRNSILPCNWSMEFLLSAMRLINASLVVLKLYCGEGISASGH